MAVYMQATIEVRGAGMEKFLHAMAQLVAILEKDAGWKLSGGFIQTSGRLNTVIDLWELEDYSHYERGMGVLRGHPQFPGIAAALGETINYETVVFAVKAPYMR
jgi:hypothetical protein